MTGFAVRKAPAASTTNGGSRMGRFKKTAQREQPDRVATADLADLKQGPESPLAGSSERIAAATVRNAVQEWPQWAVRGGVVVPLMKV